MGERKKVGRKAVKDFAAVYPGWPEIAGEKVDDIHD